MSLSSAAVAQAAAAEDKLMGYRANERGKLSEDFVAAGDGLVAFGAALILPVQVHQTASRVAAGQWIYAKQRHALMDREADKQDRQMQR